MKKIHKIGWGVSLSLVGIGWAVLKIVQKMEASAWASFVYFYGLGIPIFVICCIYVVSKKAVRLQKGGHSFSFYLMVSVFVLFVLIHALWTYVAFRSSWVFSGL